LVWIGLAWIGLMRIGRALLSGLGLSVRGARRGGKTHQHERHGGCAGEFSREPHDR